MQYISSTKEKKEGCVFCNTLADDPARDRENYLVYRGKTTFVLMNLYPYNTGHLMILPHQHVSTLNGVAPETQVDMIRLAAYFTDLLGKMMRPDGFNVGINIGSAAGAGIDSHIHMHVVPRWSGDSNFMPVISNTRVLPETVEASYDRILAALQQNPPGE
jgi:ATP adenylyltransferase